MPYQGYNYSKIKTVFSLQEYETFILCDIDDGNAVRLVLLHR